MLPEPIIQNYEGILVVRDDLIEGGTKQRALEILLREMGPGRYCFAGPVQGYAPIALGLACKTLGKGYHAHVFAAKRNDLHERTLRAVAAGAILHEVPHGRLNVVRARARAWCAENKAFLFPMGFGTDRMVEILAGIAAAIPIDEPPEVWCVAGSGTLSRALQMAWPGAKHNAVQIGFGPSIGRAKLYEAPELFQESAKGPMPPFPSCDNYDAKAWRFVSRFAKPGALFWNVAR